MTDLLFLTDVSQVDVLETEGRRQADRVKIVTADMATAARLEQLGVPFIDEWGLLGPDDVHANWAAAWDLAQRWWDEASVGGESHEFPLADIARGELHYPFERCLNARRIYDRLLDSLEVRAIEGYFLPPTAAIQTGPKPWGPAVASLSHAVLRWCAGRRGLPVRRIKIPRPLALASGPQNHEPPRSDAPPIRPAECEPPLYVTLLPSRPGYLSWNGDDRRRAAAATGAQTVLVMEFLSSREGTALENILSCTPGWRVVRVSRMAPEPGVGAWPWHESARMATFRRAKRTFDDARRRYTGAFPELFANPFLRFQFDAIWAEIIKADRLGEAFRSLIQMVRPSLVVFGYDDFAAERMFKRVARSEGTPTAALIHGGLGAALGARFSGADLDHMLVWGEKDARNVIRYGLAPEKVQTVGSVRYFDLYQSAPRKARETRSAALVEARRQLGMQGDKPIVALLTATILEPSAPIAHPAKHRETWRQIIRLASRRPDLSFVIKPHPGWDHYEFYRVLCQGGPPNLVYLHDAGIEGVLAASDIAVLVNCCTTAALEAMLFGVPVVFLRTAIYPIEAAEDPLQDGGAISVNDVVGLETVLDRLVRDDEYRRAALADAELFLASCMGGGDGTAYERMWRECERIALPAAPDGCDGAAESVIHRRLARAADLLAQEGRRTEFLTTWKELVGVLASAPPSRAEVRRVLFCLSYDIGTAAKDADELRSLIGQCFRTARDPLSLPAREERNMLTNAYLAGIACHLRTHERGRAAELFRAALLEAPRAVARLSRSPELMAALALALKEGQENAALSLSLRNDLESLRRERQLVGDQALSLQNSLSALRSSLTWKMGRILVGPGSLIKRAMRGTGDGRRER